ncbi:dicarboxylate/amino acid:cation symporter [Sphingomonas sp. ac-8]|uniref:dicarboxylate/amino acid:cation symporter n=1 Tax=Sphingomonas sp. ac-8 TaxID=3242977 RepID=UPI003A806068
MSQAARILVGLVAGLGLGVMLASQAPASAIAGIAWAEPVGTAWLNALRMTIVPLVVALLVTGVAQTAEAARAGRIATRSILLFVAILWTSSALGAFVTLGLLDWFPLPDAAAGALRATFGQAGPVAEVPPFTEFLVAIVPTNPIAAAAKDEFLPLILFTLVFAFALTRLAGEPRQLLVRLFQGLADTMLIVIGWVLWLGPVGVFALGYVVGARAGTAAFGALVHYVLIVMAVGMVVWLLAYPLARIGGRVGLARFLRATAPAQAVAISTQSSLASLPAMLRGSEEAGVPVATSGVVLPMAVALFRATGPAMNVAVAVYVAHVFGVQLGAGQIAAGIAAGAITTMGAASLPGQISFVSSIAPIGIAMGVPVEPLALLVAVETFPDLVRTLGNVTMNLAVTSVVSERVAGGAVRTESDALLAGEAGAQVR